MPACHRSSVGRHHLEQRRVVVGDDAHRDAVRVGELRGAPGDQGQPLVDTATSEHGPPDFGDRTQPPFASLPVDEEAAQLALGALAGGDVPQHSRDPGGGAAGLPDEREGLGHLDLLPVLVDSDRVAGGEVHAATHASHLLFEVGLQAPGDQSRHLVAADLLRAVTEQSFGTGIPRGERTAQVHRHDGVFRRRHDRGQPRARLPLRASVAEVPHHGQCEGSLGHPQGGQADVSGEFGLVQAFGPQLRAPAHRTRTRDVRRTGRAVSHGCPGDDRGRGPRLRSR